MTANLRPLKSGVASFFSLERNVVVMSLTGLMLNFGYQSFYTFVPLYLRSLQAGVIDIGIVFVAVQIATTLVSIPGGLLADRLGRKLVIVIGNGLGFGLYFVLFGVSNWVIALMVLFAATVFATLVQPGSSSLVAESVKADDRSRAFGTFLFFASLGLALGAFVGGFFFNWVDILIVATSGVAAALVRFLFLKETLPRGHQPDPNRKISIPHLSRDIFLLLAALLVFNFASGLGLPFYAIFSTDMLHLSRSGLGVMVGLGSFAGMLGSFLAGKVSVKLGVVRMMVMGVIVGSFLLIPWLYSPNALLAVMIFTASGFFIQFFYVGNQALMADLTAARERGSVIGVITTLAGFGSIIAPYVGGQLWLQVGPRSPFIISSLLAIAIAVPLILIRKRSHEADCPHCGRAVPQEGARFCNLCGQPIVYSKCQACGRILEKSAGYCDSCGTRQDSTEPTNDD